MVSGGSHLAGRLEDFFREERDAFGKAVADGTRNAIDIPSHYNFNPERLRLFVNGTRTYPDDEPDRFTDREGSFELTPNAGDTIQLNTAERPRYIVGYESRASAAAKGDTQLGPGDQFRVGLRDRSDPENAAFFEVNGDGDNRLVVVGQGEEVITETWEYPSPEEFDVTYQTPVRYEIQFNWYNVGRYLFRVSYTNANKDAGERQRNQVVGELTLDDDFATGDAAMHLFHELDAATSGQVLRAGSYGYNVLGDIAPSARTKGGRFTDLQYSGTGEYEPLAAIRLDEPRGNVYAQLKNTSVFPSGGSGELLTIVAPPDQTDATGFATPPERTRSNSVIEATTDISTFPNEAGDVVTSAVDPGGYQVGFSTYEATGTGTNSRGAPGQLIENKRPIYEDDVCIFAYKADGTSSRDINVTYYVEEDW